jgi:hypothetical protein
MGTSGKAVLVDGICAREGALWSDENPRHAEAWKGVIGRVLGSGLPVVEGKGAGSAGYDSVVALPIHKDGELAHVVAWYC